MFLAATVRDAAQLVGAVVAEVPVVVLNGLTTAGGAWQSIGLGDSGETYVVGPDARLRSDSRRWLEDPQQYLADVVEAGYDPALGAAVERTGSTVFLQPVETEAVAAVADGGTFTGPTRNYLATARRPDRRVPGAAAAAGRRGAAADRRAARRAPGPGG